MRYIYTPCSCYVAAVILSFLWAGCKGPLAHDPASNAPTTKKESGAEALSTDIDARTNRSSLAGHNANALEQKDRTSSDQTQVVAESDETSLNEISRILFTPRGMLPTPGGESNTAHRQGSTFSDQTQVVTELDETSLNEISRILFTSGGMLSTPGGESNTAHRQGSTFSDQTQVVAESDKTPLNEVSSILFAPGGMLSTPGGESNTAHRQSSTFSDQTQVVAESDKTSLNEISCILFTPGGDSNTANQQGSTSSNRPRVVSGSTLGETDAMAQRFGMPLDQFVSISRDLERNMKKTTVTQLGESFDSTESHRLNTTEHGRAETIPWDALGEAIQQDIRKATQALESKSYDPRYTHEKE
jgi:hypothetical protein